MIILTPGLLIKGSFANELRLTKTLGNRCGFYGFSRTVSRVAIDYESGVYYEFSSTTNTASYSYAWSKTESL